MEKRDDYVVGTETMALEGKYDENGKLGTIVYEQNEQVYVGQAPYKVMKESCSYYGSSLEGRVDFAKTVLKNNRMLPIPLSLMMGIYFIPTKAHQNHDCLWLAHNHIQDIRACENKKTKVILTDGTEMMIDMHKDRMLMKLHRSAQLQYVLQKRNKSKSYM